MRILTEEMLCRIQDKRKTDPYYASMIDHVIGRAGEIASRPGIRQQGERPDWWRCLGRIDTAALAHLFAPENTRIRTWLHDALMEIAGIPDDQWIGPFFRPRCDPPQGMLETSHIMVVSAKALGICPDILTSGETVRLLDRIRKIGLPYSRNWISAREKEGTFGSNNWSIVLLCGCAYGAALLEDEETLLFVAEQYNRLCGTMNDDFYGETTSYWSYASSEFAILRLLFEYARPDLAAALEPITVYARVLPWYDAQAVGPFYPEALQGIPQTRYANFSDANALEHLNSATLASIAAAKKEIPELAALASRIFFREFPAEAYASADKTGFRNSPDFWATLLYPEFADPKGAPASPKVRRFGDGLTVLKGNGLSFYSRAGSSVPAHAIAHRHADQGTILAAYNGVVLLDDPGICCYRLPLYQESKRDCCHSMPLFRKGDTPLPQRILDESDANNPPLNRDAGHEIGENSFLTASDLGRLYPDPLRKVLRTVWAEENHTAFIADEWEADEPIREETRFVFNNRNMAMEWRISGNECRMTRECVGVRVISLDGCVPKLSYGTLHDANHVNPGGPTQGRQGNGYEMTFASEEESQSGCRRFLLVFDKESLLDQWQVIKEDATWVLLDPDGNAYIRIRGKKIESGKC